jgi:hypothetical protein
MSSGVVLDCPQYPCWLPFAQQTKREVNTLFGEMTILVVKYRCPKYKIRCHGDFCGFKMYRNVTISAAQRSPGLSLLS